ncbi:hypothetical protein EB796_017646 [Bugula neritina]|uniref:Uncharacterized protein n=1 Tax=Bugula neritina TaxID=10212 RepID=A0A7J7JCX6_BUGNE|nr:hypothetical protein EB796_017646 [Bugula neritina]
MIDLPIAKRIKHLTLEGEEMEMGAESQCCHHNTHQSVLLSTDRQSLSTAHKYSPELDRLQNPFTMTSTKSCLRLTCTNYKELKSCN